MRLPVFAFSLEWTGDKVILRGIEVVHRRLIDLKPEPVTMIEEVDYIQATTELKKRKKVRMVPANKPQTLLGNSVINQRNNGHKRL
ncbi:hypothetical protein ACN42_g6581 [Penicillium freii]|uniref:Uncharacterized protein n=1 Tax=Penicillium freii TaxID=48697 RepID=A0A101MH95_PENFR|nr:hypothetical protein ACN42_g6581 [Penicillium freii]